MHIFRSRSSAWGNYKVSQYTNRWLKHKKSKDSRCGKLHEAPQPWGEKTHREWGHETGWSRALVRISRLSYQESMKPRWTVTSNIRLISVFTSDTWRNWFGSAITRSGHILDTPKLKGGQEMCDGQSQMAEQEKLTGMQDRFFHRFKGAFETNFPKVQVLDAFYCPEEAQKGWFQLCSHRRIGTTTVKQNMPVMVTDQPCSVG